MIFPGQETLPHSTSRRRATESRRDARNSTIGVADEHLLLVGDHRLPYASRSRSRSTMINVARGIGKTGDLEDNIELNLYDEIGNRPWNLRQRR